jgi:hypothetical protein
MKSIQELILGEIAKAIEKSGVQPVQNGVWSNTGSVYAMDGIQSRCRVGYDFQAGYFSVTIQPVQKVESSPPFFRIEGDRAIWTAVKYEDGNRIATILHELGHAIQEPKK